MYKEKGAENAEISINTEPKSLSLTFIHIVIFTQLMNTTVRKSKRY